MKAIFLTVLVAIAASFCFADNFVAPKRSSRSTFTDTTTTHTYQIDETKFDVYKTRNGAFYIWKVSKRSGKKYKYYLPKEIQIKMGRIYSSK